MNNWNELKELFWFD